METAPLLNPPRTKRLPQHDFQKQVSIVPDVREQSFVSRFSTFFLASPSSPSTVHKSSAAAELLETIAGSVNELTVGH